MKSAMCICGSHRNFETEPEKCEFCGSNEIMFSANVVADLLNSRVNAILECANCATGLFGEPISGYPHAGGWKVPGLKGEWWLSIGCKCGYHTSFSKFGIAR